MNTILSLSLLLLGIVQSTYAQPQVSCDLCEAAGPCFGSGPCAACGASAECTGPCEGCANAGPCRACFEEAPAPTVGSWPVQVPELPCDYALDKAPVTVLEGSIPDWLEGTFYHAQHTNATHQRYEGNLANPSGILALTFGGDNATVASFAMSQGEDWQQVCAPDTPPEPPFMMDCVVTCLLYTSDAADE